MNRCRRLNLQMSAVLKLPLIMLLTLACGEVSSNEAAHGSEESGHQSHKNVIGVFTGMASASRRDKGFALGVEYARRISQSFGIGAVAEYTFGDADFWVFAIPFVYHKDAWKFYVAPGIEKSSDHGTEGLVRLGAEYTFDLGGGWEIAPQLNVDFVDGEEVWVLGAFFAKSY
jgi:hypothetical protein